MPYTPITRLLIANRGEIAVRIIRTAKEMGIYTIAVYSDVDRLSPHVRLADEAHCIGQANPLESYLSIENIIEACQNSNADAVHPGYGFLSENADFARSVINAGIIFIGPQPDTIELMGDKIKAKAQALESGVPCIPGAFINTLDITEAKKSASDIGYPILVKASAGGGGKGMRSVSSEDQLEQQLTRASSEAKAAFGNPSVFIEKELLGPKHIEVQVMADSHGNVHHLLERDCSIQRRHQKVIEEAPAFSLPHELLQKLRNDATQLAKDCGYLGAGTVEFLVENGNHYFLEMNTRLQVEHPVTELVTGIDLVREQINIAMGHPMSFSQEEVTPLGHAIELRVYAEDSKNGFLPSLGKIVHYERPQGNGVRVDDAIHEGMETLPFYDPMLAKLIVHHQDRPKAIERLKNAIEEYQIHGVETTLRFGIWLTKHPEFLAGSYDIKFIDKSFQPDTVPTQDIPPKVLATFAHFFSMKTEDRPQNSRNSTAWQERKIL